MIEKPYMTVILDDDEDILDWLQALLESMYPGLFKIHAFSVASDALIFLSENRISIFISDIKMPGVFGDLLVNDYSRNHRSTSTVLMTGYPKITTLISAYSDGVQGCLIKPFTDKDLKTVLDPILQILENWTAVISQGRNPGPT